MRKGSKLTQENKDKIRLALAGRKLSDEHKKSISEGQMGLLKGIPKSKEHRQKLSEANRKFSEKNKISFHELYTKEPMSGCWLWTGSFFANGYGRFKEIGVTGQKAHRRSYEIHKGKIPEGMYVCHSCDNPPCVNPDHLWLGTNSDNMKDMVRKGRGRWGKMRR